MAWLLYRDPLHAAWAPLAAAARVGLAVVDVAAAHTQETKRIDVIQKQIKRLMRSDSVT